MSDKVIVLNRDSSMDTLPDYLTHDLDIVFVGINPGTSSVEAGHYFAKSTNRFWPAVIASGLLREPLEAASDHRMLEQGIGFTDVVKKPTASASDLKANDYREWAPWLRDKIEEFRPRIVCFHGVTGYRNYLRYGEGVVESVDLGRQARTIGTSTVFVVPNPSAANAAYSLDVLICWYKELKLLRDESASQ